MGEARREKGKGKREKVLCPKKIGDNEMNEVSTYESLPLEYGRHSYMHTFKDFHSWKFVLENRVMLSRDGTFRRELVRCGFPLVFCI